ncbi:MAG: AMP-binding protein, partial [Deltaproteobacteria bacterium]|nr:AMP-binding protein [Deltaproteobacteria bacterium]
MHHDPKPDNLVQLLENAASRFGANRLFGKIKQNLALDWTTYSEFKQRVDNLRGALAGLGVGPGDFVGVIAGNRQEWAVCAFATYGLKAGFVSMYEKELPQTWQYILQDSGIKVLFVANPIIYEAVKGFLNTIASLEAIYIFDDDGSNSLQALEKKGAHTAPVAPLIPTAQEIAALIYTSGTTGEPKGVLLSHGNLTSNAAAGYALFREAFNEKTTALSLLPWAHSYGQVAELYNWLQFGGNLVFMRSVDTLAEDLQIAAPSFLLAVPRVFNKIYSGIHQKVRERGGLAEKLFLMGLRAARRRRELAMQGKSEFLNELKYQLAQKVVFAKILKKFGGRLENALTASATMNIEVANFFIDLGIATYDAYGMTETSPAITMNSPKAWKLGSVGRPIQDVTVTIDRTLTGSASRDGEIIVHGPNVMQGYHNKPEATAAIMTDDGGIHTGDRGYLDDDGFLFITGRIKEQYKLENGKYVFPAGIE